jgi:hypothetical protein
MTYLSIAARCLLAAVLLAAAGSKLRNRASFAEFAMSLRPLGLPSSVAALTVFAEATIPALLLTTRTAPVGLVAAAVLFTGLTMVPAMALRRGLHLACRCFGPARRPLTVRHVVRNAVLLTVAVTGLTAATGGAVPAAGAVVAVGAGFVGALLLIVFDDLVDLVVPHPPTSASLRRPPVRSVRS